MFLLEIKSQHICSLSYNLKQLHIAIIHNRVTCEIRGMGLLRFRKTINTVKDMLKAFLISNGFSHILVIYLG